MISNSLNEIITLTNSLIEEVPMNSRIDIKEIANKVINQFSGDKKGNLGNITNAVRMTIDGREDVSFSLGRTGGFFRGKKPKRIDRRPRCETCHQVIRPLNHTFSDAMTDNLSAVMQ